MANKLDRLRLELKKAREKRDEWAARAEALEQKVTEEDEEPEATAKTNALPSLILLGTVAVGGIGFAVTRLKRKRPLSRCARTQMGIMRCTAGMSFRRKKWMKMMYNWQ